jgi:hypothetical protein
MRHMCETVARWLILCRSSAGLSVMVERGPDATPAPFQTWVSSVLACAAPVSSSWCHGPYVFRHVCFPCCRVLCDMLDFTFRLLPARLKAQGSIPHTKRPLLSAGAGGRMTRPDWTAQGGGADLARIYCRAQAKGCVDVRKKCRPRRIYTETVKRFMARPFFGCSLFQPLEAEQVARQGLACEPL